MHHRVVMDISPLSGYTPTLRQVMVLGLKILLAIALWVVPLTWADPATALTCRMVHDQEICILDIRRSAKYYWEYRATVRINGNPPVRDVYNCRDRTKRREDGSTVPFDQHGAGDYICRLIHHA